jgi:hypothetical protein
MNKEEMDVIMRSIYTLNEKGEPVPIKNLFEIGDREKFRVSYTRIFGTVISTVFLGVDHNYGKTGKPILWETMIFHNGHGDYQKRYTSKADAVLGHREAVRKVLFSPFEKLREWWKNLK